jgi:hypothetical protein
MAWIESHTVISRHRKLAELALGLRLRRSHAMGHLHSLWHAALEQQEDGDLSSWSDEFIADSADFPGDAPQFVRLLQQHHWLDGRLLHDWVDYVGLFLIKKYSTSHREKLVEIWRKHGREYGANGKRTESERSVSLPYLTKPTEPTGEGTATSDDRARPASASPTPPKIAVAAALEAKEKPPAEPQEQPTNRPSVEQALAYQAKVWGCCDARYRAEEVREAYRQFEAAKERGFWMWGKRQVGDWRAAMEQRMADNRERRGGKKPPASAADSVIRAINGVRVNQSQIEQD